METDSQNLYDLGQSNRPNAAKFSAPSGGSGLASLLDPDTLEMPSGSAQHYPTKRTRQMLTLHDGSGSVPAGTRTRSPPLKPAVAAPVQAAAAGFPSTCSVLGRAFISCGLHKRRVCDLAVIRLKLPSLREGQPSHMALDDGRLLAAGVGGRGGSSEDRSGGRRDEGAESLRPVPKQRYVAAH